MSLRFSDQKTSVKMGIGFGFIIAILVAVGVFAVRTMTDMRTRSDSFFERDFIGLEEGLEANCDLLRVGRASRNVLLADDAEEAKKHAANIALYYADFMKHVDETAKRLRRAESIQLANEIREVAPKWKEKVDQAIAAKLANDLPGAKKAIDDSRDFANTIDKGIEEIIDSKLQIGKDSNTENAAIAASSGKILAGSILGGAVLAVCIGWSIARRISRPLIGAVDKLQLIAQGDLTQRVDADTADEVGQLGDALNSALESIQSTLQSVRGNTVQLASASEQLSSAAAAISSGAQESASSLEETAASLEEITTTVKQNSDNAAKANQLAQSAREVATSGGAVVDEAIGAMNEINQSSKKIAEIITAIDEIAFQTNLLALNAAVEAARAGEQGRGFAVVAAEVRNLAQRSAQSAREIKSLIQDSVRKVETGSDLVGRSGKTLREIVSSIKRVTDIVAEIAAASREQSTGIDQVNTAVSQMDSVTQQNASQTEELTGTAESLAGQAQQLRELVARFHLDDGNVAEHAAPRKNAAARPQMKAKDKKVDMRAMRARNAAPKAARPVSHVHAESIEKLELDEIVPVGAPQGGTRGDDFQEF